MADPPRDGVLDPGFGTGGIARFSTISGGSINPQILNGIVALPDGGALLLGAGYGTDPLAPLLPLVMRIDRLGALVPGFGNGGAYLLPPSPAIEQFGARAIRALPLADGRIVVVSAVATNPVSFNTTYDDCAWVFALTASGVLVADFGPAGEPGCIDFGDSSGVTFFSPPVGDLLLQDASGRVLVGGYPFNLPGVGESAVARLTTDGTLDPTFGSQGLLRYGGDAIVRGDVAPGFVAVAGGYLAPAAMQFGQSVQFGVLRINNDFSSDPTFGANGFAGVAWTDVIDAIPFFRGFTVDAQGRSVIAGYARTQFGSGAPICDFCVSRFLPTGSIDPGFNGSAAQPGVPGSALILTGSELYSGALAVVALPDGRLVVAGSNGGLVGDERLLLLGLRDDASFDSRFGPAETPGRLVLDVAPAGAANIIDRVSLTLASGGGLLVGSNWGSAAGSGIGVARLVDDSLFANGFEAGQAP